MGASQRTVGADGAGRFAGPAESPAPPAPARTTTGHRSCAPAACGPRAQDRRGQMTPTPKSTKSAAGEKPAGDARERAYRGAAAITRAQLRRDAPERARVLDDVEQSDVVVVTGTYDHVQQVLGALEVPHTAIHPNDLDHLTLHPEQLLVVNCPGQVSAPRDRAHPRLRRGRRQPVHHRLGAASRDRACVSGRARLQRAPHCRRRRAHRGQGPRQPLPAGRHGRPGRSAVVARGLVVPHPHPRPGACAGPHHQQGAGREVRRGSRSRCGSAGARARSST